MRPHGHCCSNGAAPGRTGNPGRPRAGDRDCIPRICCGGTAEPEKCEGIRALTAPGRRGKSPVMLFLDRTLPLLAENLALDEALLLEAETGGPEVLRVWQWPSSAVVLGAGGRIADDVCEERCRADGVPLARRASGGGTVLL